MLSGMITACRVKRIAKAAAYILAALIILLAAAVILPLLHHKKVSSAYRASFSAADCYSESTGSERVACIDDNVQALVYRLMLIEQAQEEIVLCTFDMKDDESGKDIMASLLAAADRGVEVKLLIDYATFAVHLADSEVFQALASHPSVQVKRYNPIRLLTPWQSMLRLHDKYLIADETAYILGGRNTYDLFLGDYSEVKNIDRDLLVYQNEPSSDSSMGQLRRYFDQIWSLKDCADYTPAVHDPAPAQEALRGRYEQLKTAYEAAFTEPDWQAITMQTNKITLLSNPPQVENREPTLWYSLTELMGQGQQAVVITPYIICSGDMYKDLSRLCGGGTDVQIITNAVESGANPFGCSDYQNQRQNIRRTGVQVYEFSGGDSLHTKTVLVDDRMSIVGSFNMDMRSVYLDTELMLAVDCEGLNRALREQAEDAMEQSRTLAEDGTYLFGPRFVPRELDTGTKMKYTLLRLLSPLIRHLL